MAAFEKQVQVRFAHTDAAGIMFYPRYFGLINDLVEDWFGEGLGFDFKHLHIDEQRAVPTAHIEADFLKPSRMHDRLTFSLAVTRLGASSCHLAVAARADSEDRLKVKLVIVHMDMASGAALPWPDDMRAAMGRWMATEEKDITP
ncbi:MAG: acyl-CoA thioesterase [Alphaproteobacteria bacterium]|nr:MAG: acyl-CoA thioesterase [Alphaproteobacteria bacterium]